MPDFAAIAKLMEALCSLPPTWVELADVLRASPFEAEQTLDLLADMDTKRLVCLDECGTGPIVWVRDEAAFHYGFARYYRAKRNASPGVWLTHAEYGKRRRADQRVLFKGGTAMYDRLPEHCSENVEQAVSEAVKQADTLNRPPKRTLASYAAGAWYEHPLGPGDILRLERARKARMNGHYKPANWSYCAQCGGVTRWDTGCLMCLGKVVAQ